MDLSERPPYRISEQQRTAFEAFRKISRDEAKGKLGTNLPPFFAIALKVDQQKQLALDFWISVFDELVPEDHNENMLMSGLTVLAMREDSSFDGPIESLPKISALVNVGKALVVQKAMLEREQQIEGWVEVGESRESAERKVRSVLERVKRRMGSSQGKATVLGRLNELRELAHEMKEVLELSIR